LPTPRLCFDTHAAPGLWPAYSSDEPIGPPVILEEMAALTVDEMVEELLRSAQRGARYQPRLDSGKAVDLAHGMVLPSVYEIIDDVGSYWDAPAPRIVNDIVVVAESISQECLHPRIVVKDMDVLVPLDVEAVMEVAEVMQERGHQRTVLWRSPKGFHRGAFSRGRWSK